nr:hypothetical protein Iba_chr06dCG9650 [Ipomoea batatas]
MRRASELCYELCSTADLDGLRIGIENQKGGQGPLQLTCGCATDLITVFLNFVLNIHLASSLVLLLPVKSTIVPEIIWIILEIFGELLIVQKTVLVGHPKEEPSKAIELECWDRFHKHTAKIKIYTSFGAFVMSGHLVAQAYCLLLTL